MPLPTIFATAQQGKTTLQQGGTPEATAGMTDYQKRMLEIEEEKISLDREKQRLEQDRFKEEQSPITRYGPLGSILLALAAILAGVLNANKQARVQARLKAVEVVISASGPESAKERLRIVETLLGASFDPAIEKNLKGVGPGHDENRKALIGMLVGTPGKERLVLQLWDRAFGVRNFGKDIHVFGEMLGVPTPVSTGRHFNPKTGPVDKVAEKTDISPHAAVGST